MCERERDKAREKVRWREGEADKNIYCHLKKSCDNLYFALKIATYLPTRRNL